MPPLSRKKILFWIVVVYCFLHRAQIRRCIAAICWGMYDSLAPIRESPVEHRYVATLLVLGLLYFTIYQLLKNRK